jgi:hypothetical protein
VGKSAEVSDDLSIPNNAYRGTRAGRYGTGQGRIRPGMDPDTRRLVLFAGGLGAVLAVLIGVSSLMHRGGTETPVVAADTRPLRVKPENPGGMKIDGAENDVFSGGSDTANAKLSAAAENPDTKSLRTAEASPTPAPVIRPAVTASAPPAAKPPAPATHLAVSAPVPAAKPASAVASAAKSEKPSATAAESHAATAPHQATVQLAALTSEEAARNEWQMLSKRMPDLLNGRQPVYSRTERDGRTLWRVRTTGFADVAQARTFCERVRSKGAGCSVADF